MRWDDSQGLNPASLESRRRGVYGVLERTKTSGPGKKVVLLPVFVSSHAWLEVEWLAAGLAIWQAEPFCFPRDFFLPLPDDSLNGVAKRRARYTDSAGFSAALLKTLTNEEGAALLPGQTGSYWTEHSDRSGLDGWAAALGVGDSERGFLGRWAAKSSTDSYVRTAIRVVENIQLLTTRYARRSRAGGPDFFGEEHVLAAFTKHVLKLGHSDAEAQQIITGMMVCDYGASPEVDTAENRRAAKVWRDEEGRSGTEHEDEGDADDDEAADWATLLRDTDRTPGGLLKPEVLEEAQGELAQAGAEAEAATASGFVVCKTKGGRCRRLHHVESCRLVPGVHYTSFDVWGDLMPPEHEVTAICRICLPAGPARKEAPQVEAAEETSSSSSAGDPEPGPKKPKVASCSSSSSGE
jgi:hypothetical protein